MEAESQNLRVQTQELEEELAEAENSRLRLEVTLQALKAQFERELSGNEEKGEEKRRVLSKQVKRGGSVEITHGVVVLTFCKSLKMSSCLLLMPVERGGDPARRGEESAISGRVVQKAAGGRAAGS